MAEKDMMMSTITVNVDLPGDATSRSSQMRSPYFDTHDPTEQTRKEHELLVQHQMGDTTLQETHLIQSERIKDVLRTEEHFSSEVKSFVVVSPPKFKRMIRAYRIQPSDKITLAVEVISFPEAQFQWHFNDVLIEQDNKDGYDVSTAGNVSLLHIERPKEGIFSCEAKNPAGVSKSYGYVKIDVVQNADGMDIHECRVLAEVPSSERPPEFWKCVEKSEPPPTFKTEKKLCVQPDKSEKLDMAPKIMSQFETEYRQTEGQPLTLEVSAKARPEAQFQWRHNNFEMKPGKFVKIERIGENHERITIMRPTDGRIEVKAVNRLGKEHKFTKIVVDYLALEQRTEEMMSTVQSMDQTGSSTAESAEKDAESPAEHTIITDESETAKEVAEVKVVELIGSKTAQQEEGTVREGIDLIQIQKEEEKYALLVKVAESVAQQLVANIIVLATEEVAIELAEEGRTARTRVELDCVREEHTATIAIALKTSDEETASNNKLRQNRRRRRSKVELEKKECAPNEESKPEKIDLKGKTLRELVGELKKVEKSLVPDVTAEVVATDQLDVLIDERAKRRAQSEPAIGTLELCKIAAKMAKSESIYCFKTMHIHPK